MVRGTKFNTKSSPTFETPYESEGFFYVHEFDKVVKTKHCVSHRPTKNLEFGVQEYIVSHGLSYKGGVGNTCETINFFCLPQENSFTKN